MKIPITSLNSYDSSFPREPYNYTANIIILSGSSIQVISLTAQFTTPTLCTLTLSPTHSLTYRNNHPFTNSLKFSFIHLLTNPLTHSPTHSLTHPLTHSLTHSLIHSLNYSLTHSIMHWLTRSLAHSLTHSLTH